MDINFHQVQVECGCGCKYFNNNEGCPQCGKGKIESVTTTTDNEPIYL